MKQKKKMQLSGQCSALKCEHRWDLFCKRSCSQCSGVGLWRSAAQRTQLFKSAAVDLCIRSASASRRPHPLKQTISIWNNRNFFKAKNVIVFTWLPLWNITFACQCFYTDLSIFAPICYQWKQHSDDETVSESTGWFLSACEHLFFH